MSTISPQNWHSLTVTETIRSLNSHPEGLSPEEVQRRLAQFGPNELVQRKRISPWLIFLEQFKNLLIVILLAAVIISFVMGIRETGTFLYRFGDSLLIFIIVLFVAIFGFLQEYRAEKAMEALKRMAAPTAWVIRGGMEKEVLSREVVPGDVVLLNTGDRIPADSRLMEAVNLKAEEASLTGESIPVEKMTEPIPGEVPLGDRRNMVYMGTTVVYGRGRAVVASTGMATEFGKIADILQEVKEQKTPLEISLGRVGKWLGIASLAIGAVLGMLLIFRGSMGFLQVFLWAVSLAVAAVPEALPAVVTISLAYGMQKMAKRHALVRRLPAVETLGCITFICSDKTGTLTQNEMTVRKLYVNGQIIEVTGTGYQPEGEFRKNGAIFLPQQDISLWTLLQIGAL